MAIILNSLKGTKVKSKKGFGEGIVIDVEPDSNLLNTWIVIEYTWAINGNKAKSIGVLSRQLQDWEFNF